MGHLRVILRSTYRLDLKLNYLASKKTTARPSKVFPEIFDGSIERYQFDRVGLEKRSLLARQLLLERLFAQLLHWTQRRDVKADLLRDVRLQKDVEETTELKGAGSQEIDASQLRFGSL
jgi:hypothetical protein